MLKFYRDIKNGVRNLFLWFPIIWNDRWWDHYYLYTILRFKLGLMEEAFREDGHYVGAEKDADNMKDCCTVLDRLIADEYIEEAYKEYEKKWGRIDMKVGSDGKLDFRSNVKTDEDKFIAHKEFLDCCKVEYQLEDNDIKELFKIIARNVRKWWD